MLSFLSDVPRCEELGWVDPRGGRQDGRRRRAIHKAFGRRRVGRGEHDGAGRAFRIDEAEVHIVWRVQPET